MLPTTECADHRQNAPESRTLAGALQNSEATLESDFHEFHHRRIKWNALPQAERDKQPSTPKLLQAELDTLNERKRSLARIREGM